MARSTKTTPKKKKIVEKSQSLQVKVQRPNAPKIRAKPLPNNWPVASRPPKLSSDQSALRPGSLLQEVCSGQDIHINKQALLAPSIAREKGRYLLILPGVLSFKRLKAIGETTSTELSEQQKSSPQQPPEESNDEETEPPSNETPTETKSSQMVAVDEEEDADEEEEEIDHGQQGEGIGSGKPSAKPTLPHFGTVEGLSTATPKLRISFPNSNKSLVFPGSKVPTSSKYMWLNCSARKKGTVTCKGVFSTAIVFGAPVWETTNKDEKEGSDVTNDSSSSSIACNDRQFHYGGSDRTIDGVSKGSKKKAPVDLSAHVPIITREPILDERGLPTNPVMGIYPSKEGKPKGVNEDVQTTTIDLSDDDASDDAYMENIQVTTAKARSTPKRQASAKKTKYTVDLLDSDDDTGDNSEGDDDEKPSPAKTTKTPPRRRSTIKTTPVTPLASKGNVKTTTTRKKTTTPKAKTTKKTTSSPESLLESDSKDSDREVMNSKTKATNSKPGRKSMGRQKPKKLQNEQSSDEEVFALSDEEEVVETTQRRSSTRASRSSTSKPSYKENEDSDAENDNDDDDDDNDDNSHDSPKSAPKPARKAPAKKKPTTTNPRRRSRATSKTCKEPEESADQLSVADDDNDNDDECDVEVTKTAQSSTKNTSKGNKRRNSASSLKTTPLMESPSPSVLSSPHRSRRRKSSGVVSTIKTTTPAKRTVFDLSKDEDFSF